MPETTDDKPRRIMLTVNDRLASALRTLGYDPDAEPDGAGRGGGPCGAVQIRAALRRYAAAIADSRRRLARVFGREEWNLMADVMNGCLGLHDYGETPHSIGVMLMANVQDGCRLDGAGRKWFGDDGADAKVEALLRKLVKLTAIEQDAVAVAIRRFWADPDVDPAVDEWWLPAGLRAGRKEG